MNTGERGQLPPDLVCARDRFQAWRAQRQAGGRIPQALWAMATRLAKAHGVSRTSAVLGLDSYSLQKRAEAGADEPQSKSPAFIELPSPVVAGKHCLLELDNGAGISMRLQLVGYDAAAVEALARRLWNAD